LHKNSSLSFANGDREHFEIRLHSLILELESMKSNLNLPLQLLLARSLVVLVLAHKQQHSCVTR